MTVPGVDLDALAAWMDGVGLPSGEIDDVAVLAGGTQNVLVAFRRGGRAYVLRRPPEHKRANSDETMRREARVLAALAGSAVPHPGLIAACGDTDVLGAAFYLMEPVAGVNPAVELPAAYRGSADARRALGFAVVDAAAAIGALDHEALGLADLGRSEGFLERQVGRWRGQLEGYGDLPGYPGPDLPGVDEVGAWLERHRPRDWRPGLMHGDLHLGNVLAAPETPTVAAVVDWELTTVGDPLLDLGWLLATWPDPDGSSPVVASPCADFPRADEVVARYAERSTRSLDAVTWYEVLACYKLGILLEGTHARACAGQAERAVGDRLHAHAAALFERARHRIAGGPA
jgi:aminoglycoside phosphotransferase (APT) family kinase protein